MSLTSASGFELISQPNDLLLAKRLAEHLRSILQDLRPKGRVLHIAHSGGAILTYLAAKYHLSYAESNRIDVVTLGGGRSLTHKYFKGRILNYYARNDPVLMLEKRASSLMKLLVNNADKNLTTGLSNVSSSLSSSHHDAIQDGKHNTTFVFMQPIANDPLADHSMYGPTYRLALTWEAEEYRKRLEYMMLLAARDKDFIRLLRKQIANITGYHHFWTSGYSGKQHNTIITSHIFNVALTGRRIRKYASSITNIHGLFSGKPSNHPLSTTTYSDGMRGLFGYNMTDFYGLLNNSFQLFSVKSSHPTSSAVMAIASTTNDNTDTNMVTTNLLGLNTTTTIVTSNIGSANNSISYYNRMKGLVVDTICGVVDYCIKNYRYMANNNTSVVPFDQR